MNSSVKKYELYQYPSCPYCRYVLMHIQERNDIELKNTISDPEARAELLEGGGKTQVPCLKITYSDGHVEWMYESRDIVGYLEMNQEEVILEEIDHES